MKYPHKKQLCSYIVTLFLFLARYGRIEIFNSRLGGSREVLISNFKIVFIFFFCGQFSSGHISCGEFQGAAISLEWIFSSKVTAVFPLFLKVWFTRNMFVPFDDARVFFFKSSVIFIMQIFSLALLRVRSRYTLRNILQQKRLF